MARKISFEIPSANLAILLRKMPPNGPWSLKMLIWPGRKGRHLLLNKGPIKVLRGKHWRYMKRRLEQFAKANKKKCDTPGEDADLSARLIWRVGYRKGEIDEPDDLRWAHGWTWSVWCA